MTTNQTIDGVPRELLEDMLNPCADFATHDRLRALLDAERCTSCDGPGDLIDLTGEWRGYCICPVGVALNNKPASQSQGAPVAELQVAFFEGGPKATINWFTPSAFEPGATKLYAEQPAPVAVVLPERRSIDEGASDADQHTDYGWNACLDEVARLNSARPNHASPPPGTEPSGTHHDNDGLDDYRNTK